MIQKVFSNRFYSNALKLLLYINNRNSLYDIDDAEYLRNNDKSIRFFMKRCSAVSVGSSELEKYALRLNKNVFLNTSAVKDHPFTKEHSSEIFTIGWVGDYGNGHPSSYVFSHKRALLEITFPAIRNLLDPVRFIIIGITKEHDRSAIRDYFMQSKNIELLIPEDIDWKDEDWLYKEISKFDIGLAPLIDHEFNKAKSAYKIKQYLSCGVPALASPVGENPNFIFHGENGFLCQTDMEFERYMDFFMAMNDEDYKAFSLNAHNSAVNWRTSRYCDILIEHFSNINN